MPIFDSECDKCTKTGLEYIALADIENYDLGPRHCECGGLFRRVFRKAPGGSVKQGGAQDYARDVANTRRRCRQHFVKSGEMDQCKHEHGKVFDEALVSAAASRIANGETDDV